MPDKPDYLQRPLQQGPAQQEGAATQGGGAVQLTWSPLAHSTPIGAPNATQLGQPQQATAPAPSLGPPSAGQTSLVTTPNSQTFGVSFTGTAKFAPLPFPPCEHRLPPPSSGPTSPPIATMHPLPPPPPYTERSMHIQTQLHMPAAQAHSQPLHTTGPSPMLTPAAMASASFANAPASSATPGPPPARPMPSIPLVPQPTMQAMGVPRPPSTGVMLFPTGAPPPPLPPATSAPIPVPVPVFVSTRPGMLPYGQHAPVLTPWPPIPLRHIDSYLAGAWPPPSTVSNMPPITSFAAPQHAISPVQFASLQQKHTTPSMAPIPPSWMSAALAPQAPTTVFPVQVPMPFPQLPLPFPQVPSRAAPNPATTASTESPDTCMVRDCQAHSFCELSPCRCRICRDHLGWVMRGARMIDLATGGEVDMLPQGHLASAEAEHGQSQDRVRSGGTEVGHAPERDDGKSTPRLVKKMYRCTACGRQSAMETPKKPTDHDETSGATSSRSSHGGPSVHDAAADEGDGEAFSIKYFSHGPVSHPVQGGETTSSGGQADVAPLSPSIDYATAVDPVGDASFMHYPPAMLPYDPYAFVPSEEIWSDPYSSLGAGASLYWPKGYAEQYATPIKPVAGPSGDSHSRVARRHSLAIKTEALEPVQRCSSAVASPTSVEPTVQVPPTTPPSRPASSPSALETGISLEGAIARLTTRTAPSPPESARTPSPMSSSPYGGYGGYGTLPSPPLTRDDMLEYGFSPFGGTRSGSYPLMGDSAYATIPTATPGSYPPGSVSVATPSEEAAMYAGGYPTPGLGLTGLYTPESSFFTPPRMSQGKKRNSPFAVERSKGGGKWTSPRVGPRGEFAGGSPMGATPIRTSYNVVRQLPPELDGSLLEKREWPIVKIENIPFNTTLAHLEAWLPKGVLAPSSSVVLPIHLILHRASGRTLPHCYIETASHEAANRLIHERDRSGLGDRTVRVKWERAGELLRDLFAQSCYFTKPSLSPAAAPLPHLPPEGFRLPGGSLLSVADVRWLLEYCTRPINMRERPLERAFYNLASILAQYPWERRDLWDDALRNELFHCVLGALDAGCKFATANAPGDLFGQKRMLWTVNNAFQMCPAFSQSEKERVRRTVEKGFARPSRDVPPGTSSEREYPPLKETSASAAQHPMTPSRIAKNATAFSSPETPTPIAGRAASQITTGGYSKIASKATALSAAGVLKTQAGAPTPAAYSAGRPAIPAALSSSQAVQKGMILARQAAETPSAVRGVDARVPSTEGGTLEQDVQGSTAAPAAPPADKGTAAAPIEREAGPARGWLATPPESPIAQRQKGAHSGLGFSPTEHEGAEKGWAEE